MPAKTTKRREYQFGTEITERGILYRLRRSKDIEFAITFGDITQTMADAIVCPANGAFQYAGSVLGGVQLAIMNRAGPEVFTEVEERAEKRLKEGKGTVAIAGEGFITTGLPVGATVVTGPGGIIGIKGIIHVNNMRVENGKPPCDAEVVKGSVLGVLKAADEKKYTSVAFPALGTGVWGMPVLDSLKATYAAMHEFYRENKKTKINRVEVVIYAPPSSQDARKLDEALSPLLRTGPS